MADFDYSDAAIAAEQDFAPGKHWRPITPEMERKLAHLNVVVQRMVVVGWEMARRANAAAAPFNRPSEAKNLNFGVSVQNNPNTKRPRVFVRPLGRTGIHVEQAQSVLLKVAASMGAKGSVPASAENPVAHVEVAAHVGKGSANTTFYTPGSTQLEQQ